MDKKAENLEALTKSMGWKIFSEIEEKAASFWESAWWEKQVMEWCLSDEEIKLQALRFIDAFPSLKSAKETVRLLKEYFPHPKHRLPLPLQIGEKLIGPAMLTPGATKSALQFSIRKIALHFISGANIKEAMKVLKRLEKEGVRFTLDLLGEAVTNEKEAELYTQGYIDMIQALSAGLGEEAEINVSLKLSSLYSQFDPISPEETIKAVSERLGRILLIAQENQAFVNVDMEHLDYRDLALEIFKTAIEREEFKDSNRFGIVVQAYLKDSKDFLGQLLHWLREKNREVTIRLVKGAYWDYEIINARQKNWPIPVFTNKSETDANFEELTQLLLQNHQVVRTAMGTHNIRSIARAMAMAEEYQVPQDRFEFQLLYGMGDLIQKALAKMNYPVRIYTPYGELIPGMAYLVRRILENTANESFLRQTFEEHLPKEQLLAAPQESLQTKKTPKKRKSKKEAAFENCPLADFALEKNRGEMNIAVWTARERLGTKVPIIIGGKKYELGQDFRSVNPSDHRETVGWVSQANQELADKAVETAVAASGNWGKTSPEKRANFLFDSAEIMRERRFDLAAWIITEVGKTRREADADVVEAIDFLNYYGHEILRIGKTKKTDPIPGEDNFYGYRPRGVGLIIAPWNFPLAILTGMASGALAAGNSVIMKPSNNSPVIGYKLMGIFQDAGLPDGVVNFLPGRGEVIGDYLIQKNEIDFITFTGSMEVGLRIKRMASEEREGIRGIKNVIAEMGGKNPIIVDGSADLDETVKATMASAFGYGGQKCSAASRIVVLKEVYEPFLERFVEGVKSIRIGKAEDPASFYGPLIDAAAVEKVRRYTEIGKGEAELVLERDLGDLEDSGYFIGPRVFSGVSPNAVIAQEEIFGPVVSVIPAKGIKEAVSIANQSRYALTAGLFSRSPGNIEYAKSEIEAGNIYINRGIMGAVVRRQPFGGYKMSGIGSKAGGPDYLKQFMYPITVSENTTRHGFAPIEME